MRPALILSMGFLLMPPSASGQVVLTNLGVPVSENFNILANTGTSSLMPLGWAFDEAGTLANGLYTAGTGSSNVGDTYSFGSAGSIERALGSILSGSLTPQFGAAFLNNTGSTITSFTISYTGEQWRLGTTGRADRLDFQFSTSATLANFLTTGTYSDFNALDFNSPNTLGTVGALDGNSAGNRTALTTVMSGLNVPQGANFFIRWQDFDATGADDGLGIDDFSITPTSVPEPSSLFLVGLAGYAAWRRRKRAFAS
jgi:hypothetical protein